MTAITITPEQLLASDPELKQGVKTHFRPEGNRTLTYTWTVGPAVNMSGEAITLLAVLNVTHNKGRRPYYSATLWQHEDSGDTVGTVLNGRNGSAVYTEVEGAARFSVNKLHTFGPRALNHMRTVHGSNPEILRYFRPERV